MEYLLILVLVFLVVGMFADFKQLDAQEYRNKVRKSIEKDAAFQIGRTWILQGHRREW